MPVVDPLDGCQVGVDQVLMSMLSFTFYLIFSHSQYQVKSHVPNSNHTSQ
nr:hypothetical protein Q903MT_gene1666 [Picea sitchensis]